MEDMDEYMRCLDVIALTNHIDEEEFEFEEKPVRHPEEPRAEDNNKEIEIKEDDPSPTDVKEDEEVKEPAPAAPVLPEAVEPFDETNTDVIQS